VLATGVEVTPYDGRVIEESDVTLRLHYDEEAQNGLVMKEDSSATVDEGDGWERWSLPPIGYAPYAVLIRTLSRKNKI
jgi:hypothetical protein